MEKLKGRILKSVGGIFYAETDMGILGCKAKGLFRIKEIMPCAGDYVSISLDGDVLNTTPVISEVEDRKKNLVRPQLSNLDTVIIVISLTDPSPNAYIIDKLLAILELKEIEPALAFTKIDQKTLESFSDIYVCAGFKTFFIDNTTGEGTEELSEYIDGKTSAFIGNSGVGKSSLLNVILPNLRAATAVTSKKLGRGRHTTREVELYRYNQGYVADTPGFSTVDASRYGDFTSEDLIYGFREFVPYIMKCPYKGCTHTGESECSVKAAVTKGEISESRYKSYNMIYSDIKKSENIY